MSPEGKVTLVFVGTWLLSALVSLSFTIACIYVVLHFLLKFW